MPLNSVGTLTEETLRTVLLNDETSRLTGINESLDSSIITFWRNYKYSTKCISNRIVDIKIKVIRDTNNTEYSSYDDVEGCHYYIRKFYLPKKIDSLLAEYGRHLNKNECFVLLMTVVNPSVYKKKIKTSIEVVKSKFNYE